MRFVLTALLLAVVPACSHASSRPTMAPDGRQAWAISCSRRMSSCWDEAAQRCPAGYDVYDQQRGYSARGGYGGFSLRQTGEMLVVCR
jgi:hypothetical protein